MTEISSASSPPVQRRFSGRDLKKVETAIKLLEEWNDRFLKRVIIFLFLGDSNLPTSGERERALRSYEALDHIHSLRKAVRTTISNARIPERLLLDKDDTLATRVQLPHSSLWIVQPS